MKNIDLAKKLSSRKLWVAVAGIATGVALALGANTSDIQSVAGAVTALVSAMTYILTEGKVDAERVKTAVEASQTAIETIENIDEQTATGDESK